MSDIFHGLRQAVFLVGGRGTRLGSLTDAVPKPLLPVAGRPFLDYLMEVAVGYGVDDIILSCGYLADILEQRYRDGGPGGCRVRCVVEPEPAGTGGALHYARGLLEDRFFMVNGDSFFELDWRSLADEAGRGRALGTLALRRTAPGRRYGTVGLDGQSITGFFSPGEDRSGPVNGGLYVLRREIVGMTEALPCSIESDVFPGLAKAGRLKGVLFDGYFIDIGIPDDYQRAQHELPDAVARSRASAAVSAHRHSGVSS
jgi:D-glycero-D-manno-heptose 1,7-bisphosphate phosphatase